MRKYLIPFSSDRAALVEDDLSASRSEDIVLLASTEAKEQDEDCPGKGYEDEAPGTAREAILLEVAGPCRRLTEPRPPHFGRNPCAAPCCAHNSPCRFLRLQLPLGGASSDVQASHPSHVAAGGSRIALPRSRGQPKLARSAGSCRRERGQTHPLPHLQPSSRPPEAPACPGSRRTDVLPSSAAVASPRPSYVVCSSGSRSSPDSVLMASGLSLSRTYARCCATECPISVASASSALVDTLGVSIALRKSTPYEGAWHQG